MKWSFATVGLIAAGLVGIVIILLFQNITINNEEDYYLLKEISEAAMIDAIDLAYYRDTGKLKIVQEKFVENFTRRFAEAANVMNTNNYYIEFFDIMEKPPKVSIIIRTDIGEYTIFGNNLESRNYSVANSLDAIIEIDEMKEKKYDECYQTLYYTSVPYVRSNNNNYDNYTPQVIGSPSDYGYSGDWEVIKSDNEYAINFNAHLYTVQQYNQHINAMTERKMYPEYKVTGYETNAEGMGGAYFATVQTEPELKLTYDSGRNKYIVDWKMNYYECMNETDFITYNGERGQSQCFLGISYKVQWFNKQCNKN